MKMSEAFPSKWLKAVDLNNQEYTMTMKNVVMESFGDDNEQKPVLYFVGAEKGLMLNKTNAESIAIVYGDETANWIGKQVLVYPDVTQYQGKRVDCIRVRAVRQDGGAVIGGHAAGPAASPDAPRPNTPTPGPVPGSGIDLDEEIPF